MPTTPPPTGYTFSTVDRAERGRGLGSWLVGAIRDEWARRGLRRLVLVTDDAQPVYRRLGFTGVVPGRWMELDLAAVTSRTRKEQNASDALR